MFLYHGRGSTEYFIKDCPKDRKNFALRNQIARRSDQIKFTECQEIDETQEQSATSESTAPTDNDFIQH